MNRFLASKSKSNEILHKCKIRRDSISQLPKLYPDASLRDRSKRSVGRLFLISPNHPEVFHYMKSHAAIEKESKRQVEKYPGFKIHPLSDFRKFWNIIIFIIMFVHQLLSSFTIAFFIDLEPQSTQTLTIFDLVVCLLLFIEILLTLCTGHIVQETYEIILDRNIIARKYFKKFIFDLFHCIPFVFIATFIDDGNPEVNGLTVIYMCCLFLFSFFRFNRIFSYFSSVPIMLQLSEKGTVVLMLCLRTIYW